MYFILFQIFTSTDYKIEIVKQFRKPVVLTPYIIVQWNINYRLFENKKLQYCK